MYKYTLLVLIFMPAPFAFFGQTNLKVGLHILFNENINLFGGNIYLYDSCVYNSYFNFKDINNCIEERDIHYAGIIMQ